MKIADAFALARASNLPTVWTNVLAGLALAGGASNDPRIVLLLLALSCSYVGGMYLNDAFDADFDRDHRPERPIPSGRVSVATVRTIGLALLVAGWALVVLGSLTGEGRAVWPAVLAASALAAAILIYDLDHKGNPFSVVLMGLCRWLSYVVVGLVLVAQPPAALYLGASLLFCYLVGLSFAARQEHLGALMSLWPLALLLLPAGFAVYAGLTGGGATLLCAALFLAWLLQALSKLRRRAPGDVPAAVSALLAGICLWDATLLAWLQRPGLAAVAVLGFALCLLLQRRIAAT